MKKLYIKISSFVQALITKVYLIISILALALLGQTVHAEDESGLFAQLRFGSTSTEDAAGDSVSTQTLGGHLGYVSPAYKGMNLGVTFYTTNPIGADSDGFFLSSKNKGYSLINEAWLQAEFVDTHIKIGRQGLDTPFVDTDDVGMVPNTVQGVVINNNSFNNTTITAAYLDKWAGVDADTPEKFTNMNGSDGVQMLGVIYENKHWDAQLWQYWQKNATDMSYAELNHHAIEGLNLGVQYALQKDHNAGGTGKVWGTTASYTAKHIALRIDYNKVSSMYGVINGFGGGPYFTSGEINTIDDTANVIAKAIGIEYTGIDKLTLGLRKITFDQGIGDEFDATLNYKVYDNLSIDLIHSDLSSDGKNTRFFVNYDINF